MAERSRLLHNVCCLDWRLKMRLKLVWLLLSVLSLVPVRASTVVYAGNCWQSDGTSNLLGSQDCSIVSDPSTASVSTPRTLTRGTWPHRPL
jgi:hypothetical protein